MQPNKILDLRQYIQFRQWSGRRFWHEIRAALQGRIADYDLQKERFTFDPENFEQIDLGVS